MSRGQSAFSLVGNSAGLRDTFQLRASDVSETNSISSSDKHSSIPELTRLEEQAIKRSSAAFAPIGQTADIRHSPTRGGGYKQEEMAQSGAEFIAKWRPSGDWMMSLEGVTGTRQTTEWDGDGLEVSQQNSNPKIDLIPTHVRGSTPDSVASTGNIRISNTRGEHADINAGNLQANSENRNNKPLMNMAKSTREFVQNFTTEYDEPSTSTADVDIQMRRGPGETDGQNTDQYDAKSEKKRLFLPRCILLLVIVTIAIAGIVALIINFKDSDTEKQRGHIVPDPIAYVECPSRSFSLKDELNFTCTFDVTHPHRKVLTEEDKILVIPKNRVLTALSFNTELTKGSTHYEFFFTGNLNASCSSAGSYDVIFLKQDGNKELHRATVTLSIKASSLTTTFKQRQLTGNSCLKTEFDATCELHHDCNNYQTTLFKNTYGREENLNQYMKCKRNYTDTEGYMVSCSATFPEDLVEDYVSLGCKMVTTRQDNRRFKLEKDFLLPKCDVEENCHTYIPGNPRPFNCSAKSTDIQRMRNATCDFPPLTACFKPGRQIFSDIYKDYENKLTCKIITVPNVQVCRLSWCRNYNVVVKNEIPGVAICTSSYEEPYVTPHVTTSTERPTNNTGTSEEK